MQIPDVVHWFKVIVINEKRETIECLLWSGLKWEIRLKWDWYFKYRAALLQVKYPRMEVISTWGNEPATGKTLDEIKRDKVRRKKAKITEYKNNVERVKRNWTSLFPIEDDPHYNAALRKISNLEKELETL